MFIYENPNPENKVVGDCVIRAISILTVPIGHISYYLSVCGPS